MTAALSVSPTSDDICYIFEHVLERTLEGPVKLLEPCNKGNFLSLYNDHISNIYAMTFPLAPSNSI